MKCFIMIIISIYALLPFIPTIFDHQMSISLSVDYTWFTWKTFCQWSMMWRHPSVTNSIPHLPWEDRKTWKHKNSNNKIWNSNLIVSQVKSCNQREISIFYIWRDGKPFPFISNTSNLLFPVKLKCIKSRKEKKSIVMEIA